MGTMKVYPLFYEMANYKMTLSYDGSRYLGWQRLGQGELTIQGTLEQAIRELTGYCTKVHGSGRTDAGVHAKGQVAHFHIPGVLPLEFLHQINQILPEDIRVRDAMQIPADFHSRYSARAKTYSYSVDTGEKAGVFTRKYCYHYPRELDLGEMRKAARFFIGIHDFCSFTDDKRPGKSKVRRIDSIEIRQKNTMLTIIYEGDGFLQHMVRILTGTLLEVGCGIRAAEEIPKIIKERARAKAGFLAPAKGLCLEHVTY